MRPTCVFVVGPESSGSRLISRIVAHVLGVRDFEAWDGAGCRSGPVHRVWHESLPAGDVPAFPDIDRMIAEHRDGYEIVFVLATRDITISEGSRIERFSKPLTQVREESRRARDIMQALMRSEWKTFVWSYETFMFLGIDYLKRLYDFLDVRSDFIPPLVDGNRERLTGGRLPFRHNRLKRFAKTRLLSKGR